jgi:hypothetical protein
MGMAQVGMECQMCAWATQAVLPACGVDAGRGSQAERRGPREGCTATACAGPVPYSGRPSALRGPREGCTATACAGAAATHARPRSSLAIIRTVARERGARCNGGWAGHVTALGRPRWPARIGCGASRHWAGHVMIGCGARAGAAVVVACERKDRKGPRPPTAPARLCTAPARCRMAPARCA